MASTPAAVERRSFRFRSGDGIELDGALHLPAGAPNGAVLLLHGITVDMDEGGFFTAIADAVADAGHAAMRFSFRGHGASGGTQEGMTIAGEMLDALAAFGELRRAVPGVPVAAVSASFGTVSLVQVEDMVGPDRMVLLNPVVDLRGTFIEPDTEWGRACFRDHRRMLRTEGCVTLPTGFRLGPVLFREMGAYDIAARFATGSAPALVVHGDRDTCVSYEAARRAAAARSGCTFETVAGSDHGFADVGAQPSVVAMTVAFLTGAP